MKLERVSDGKVFDAIGIAEDRNRASVPVALLGAVQPVDDVSPDVWVFNADGRLHAAPGDCIVFDGPIVIAVLKAAKGTPKGWRAVKEAAPK